MPDINARQADALYRLWRRKAASKRRAENGRKPRPKPTPQLPPPPTDEEYQRWLDEQSCAGRTIDLISIA